MKESSLHCQSLSINPVQSSSSYSSSITHRNINYYPSLLYPSPQQYLQVNPPIRKISHSKSLRFESQHPPKAINKTYRGIKSGRVLAKKSETSGENITPSNWDITDDNRHKTSHLSNKSYSDLSGGTICLKYNLVDCDSKCQNEATKNTSQKIHTNKKGTVRKSSFFINSSSRKSSFTGEISKPKSARTSFLNKSTINTTTHNSIDDFRIIKKIGEGTTAKVYLVQHKLTHMIFALKCISKQICFKPHLKQSLIREIRNNWKMKDPNIVTLYDIFDNKHSIYLVLQYLKDGTLYELWKNQKKLPERIVSKIVYDIAKGIRVLHESDIIHRDLKLQNIFIQEGVAKIGDFGCSVETKVMRKSQIGSPNYLSPEQLSNHFYNNKIDIWSLGIITYELLLGVSPYQQEICQILLNGKKEILPHLKFPEQSTISETAKAFIRKLLQLNIIKRVAIQEALHDEFLQQTICHEKKTSYFL